MKLLDSYLKLQEQIYSYFGYVEDWVAIPIDDRREYVWCLYEGGLNSSVRYAWTLKELRDEGTGNYYEDEIYTQRFLPKHIYRGEDYTMICVDTGVDGNKFLAIYDNKKEVPDDEEVDINPSLLG